jgi:hypothetical protein
MGLKHKRKKAYRQETELVSSLLQAGLLAEKIRDQEGRRKDSSEGGDVRLALCGSDYPIECRHYKEGFEKTYAAVEKAPIALIKQNHKRYSLWIVRDDVWIKLIKLAERREPPTVEAAE